MIDTCNAPVAVPVTVTAPPLTHYIGRDSRTGLCGTRGIVLDLRPFHGRISCAVCLDLWAQGYSLNNLPPRA